MTRTPADVPNAPAGNKRLADVIVRLRGADYPLAAGLVASVGGRAIFVPIDQVSSFDGDPLRLASSRLSLRHFDRREGEVLLRADMLGHRLIDGENARLIRAADLELAKDGGDWLLAGVATGRRSRRRFGLLGPQLQADVVVRDWRDFEWLIGHAGSAVLRSPFARIRKLKPAQIADLPVVDDERRLLGVITVDDVLEVTLPEDWRRRKAAAPPDTRHRNAR
jgi:hypothetical protein